MSYPAREAEKLDRESCLAMVAVYALYIPAAIIIGTMYWTSRLLDE